MSRYTMQLRTVCDICGRDTVEGWFKDYEITDYLTDDEIAVVEERGTWSKDKLAKLVVDNYYMSEIGYETIGYFEDRVKIAMKLLMEEYLPLIYSAAIEYDPLVNVDFTETYTSTDSGSASGSSTDAGLTINSDTPQGNVNKTDILAGNYASSTTGVDNSSSSSSTTSNTSSYTKNTKGNSGVSATAQKMVQLYRDNIRAINREIIDKLNVHFMGLYN